MKNAINKVISKNESALMNIAKKLDDVFAPVRLAQTPDGMTIPVKEETTRIQDVVSKIVDDAKSGGGKAKFDGLDLDNASTKQKDNYGEHIADDNLINNQSLKDAGYDLKSVGREAPKGPNDKIVKGIDGLYENMNPDSNIKYVIDEAKFGSSKLGNTKDNLQMSDDWLTGSNTGKNRILKAVDNDKELAEIIEDALENGQVERVLSKVDSTGKVTTYKLDSNGEIIGEWP